MRVAVIGKRQFQSPLEEIGHDALPLLVRDAIGEQRHQRAADDVEQAKAEPKAQQQREPRPSQVGAGIRCAESIDDTTEQHRLRESRGSQRDIGDGKRPGQPRLPVQGTKDA